MSKEAPWHSKTMVLAGASPAGGDERVYHDNDVCPSASASRRSGGKRARGRI